jgi:ATP-dependent RNA helicase DeaD
MPVPPQIVVATPGRLCDHLASGTVDAATVNLVVVDEADQLSSIGFLQQLEQVGDFR